jgi:hypothetical protein
VRASALGFDAYSSRVPGCSREVGARVGRVGRAQRHGCHEVNSSSTWRALLCPTWSPFFGIFGADSDLGAYRKVVVLRMLFYLY